MCQKMTNFPVCDTCTVCNLTKFSTSLMMFFSHLCSKVPSFSHNILTFFHEFMTLYSEFERQMNAAHNPEGHQNRYVSSSARRPRIYSKFHLNQVLRTEHLLTGRLLRQSWHAADWRDWGFQLRQHIQTCQRTESPAYDGVGCLPTTTPVWDV